MLRQGDQPHGGERAGHFPGAPLRRRAWRTSSSTQDHDVDYTDTRHHAEHARRLSDRVHRQREDSVHGGPSDRRDLPDVPMPSACCRQSARCRRRTRCITSSAGTRPRWRAPRWASPSRRRRSRRASAGPSSCGTRTNTRRLLAAKMKQAQRRVWLVNTGWTGGGPASANASASKHTRAIIDAIHEGALAKSKTERDPVFGFDVVTECPQVPLVNPDPAQHVVDSASYDAGGEEAGESLPRELQDLRIRRRPGHQGQTGPPVKKATPDQRGCNPRAIQLRIDRVSPAVTTDSTSVT